MRLKWKETDPGRVVVAIVMFGDPSFVAGASYNAGTTNNDGVGAGTSGLSTVLKTVPRPTSKLMETCRFSIARTSLPARLSDQLLSRIVMQAISIVTAATTTVGISRFMESTSRSITTRFLTSLSPDTRAILAAATRLSRGHRSVKVQLQDWLWR